MKSILTFLMLIFSTFCFSQVHTYHYSSNGYSTTTTVVGRSVYSFTTSPNDKPTISNRKYKKILKEQREREIKDSISKENLKNEVYNIKDSVEHISNLIVNNQLDDKLFEELSDRIFELYTRADKLCGFSCEVFGVMNNPMRFISDKAQLYCNNKYIEYNLEKSNLSENDKQRIRTLHKKVYD